MANVVKYKKIGNVKVEGSTLYNPVNSANVPNPASTYYTIFNDVSLNKMILLDSNGNKYSVTCGLTANTTVTFTSNMTAAAMQALINLVPRNLNGYTLTFQFGDGTYNTSMTSQLMFDSFNGGYLTIQGNITETDASALHTTQQVYLDFSAGTSSGIVVVNCSCKVLIKNLKVKISDTEGVTGIMVTRNLSNDVWYNYCFGSGKTTSNIGIYSLYNNCRAYKNYVSTVNFGISAQAGGFMFSDINDDTGTAPNYGLGASSSSTIGKNSTQPAGTTANEYTSAGGVIR